MSGGWVVFLRKFDLLALSWILLGIVAFGSMAFGIVFAVLGTPPFILEFIGMDWSAIVAFSPLLAGAFARTLLLTHPSRSVGHEWRGRKSPMLDLGCFLATFEAGKPAGRGGRPAT